MGNGMSRDVLRAYYLCRERAVSRVVTSQEPDPSWVERALGAGGAVAWEWWIDGQRARWHGDSEQLHGLPAGSSIPADLDAYLELVHPGDREILLQRFAEAVAGADPYEVGYRIRTSGGEVRWLRLHGTVIRNEDGRAERITGTLVDETRERQAERRLARTALRRGFLADVSEYLAGMTSEPEELIDGVTRRIAAFLGATCLIRLIGDEAARLGALVVHGDRPGLFAEAQELVSRIGVDSALVDSLQERPRTLRFPTADGSTLPDLVDPRYRDVVDRFAPGPTIVVPLLGEGRLFGILMVVRHEHEEGFHDEETQLVAELGRRIQLAIRNAMLVGSLRAELERREAAEDELAAHMAQQRALVELSRRALERTRLSELLHDAVTLIADTLDVPMAAVLELAPAERTFLVRAGVGWPAGYVGDGRVPASEESQAGRTLAQQRPVIVTGLPGDGPGPDRAAVDTFGVRSAVTVLVTGPHGPYGVLGVYDRHPRSFDDLDAGFLQAAGNVLGSAVERFRAQRRFLQAQRMEAVGRIAGGIAHDFNNLLTIIIGYAEMLRMEVDGETATADLDELRGAADRAAELVDNLLTFSRHETGDGVEVLDVGEALLALEPMLRRVVFERITLDLSVAGQDLTAGIAPGELQQVVLNLVINAGDAMPDGGRIGIRVGSRVLDASAAADLEVPPGHYVAIEVSDTGTGMEPEVVGRAVEPFYTTKPVGVGTGLGLSTAYGIVRGRGGALTIDSQRGGGTTVRLLLPHHRRTGTGGDGSRDPVRTPAEAEQRVDGTILLVEDDDRVRTLTARVLRERGYEVIEAGGGRDALELAQRIDEVDLLVTDVVMPNMTGPELASELRALVPDITTLYVSGYSEDELPFDGVFVSKPYRIEHLAHTVGMLLRRAREGTGEAPDGT